MVLKINYPHAFVLAKINLMYHMLMSPPNSFYMPPQSEDATFYIDAVTMVMSKKFSHIEQFNNL